MKNAKKIAFKSITLFLFVILVGCVEDKKEPCPECPCPDLTDESYDNGIIFPDRARKLYVNYENRRVRLIEDYEKDDDNEKKGQQPPQNQADENDSSSDRREFKVARYVSYEYEDLKKYLAYIENEAKLSGEKLSTMRFYFVNYANEKEFEDGKPVQHPRQNSIIMSPTVNVDGNDHIFYTTDGEEGKRKIVLLQNDFRQRDGEGNQEPSDAKNEASLLPGFLLPSRAPLMFADRSTTKNEGGSHP